MTFLERVLTRTDQLDGGIEPLAASMLQNCLGRRLTGPEWRKALLAVKEPHELLSESGFRGKVLELLKPLEALELCKQQGVGEGVTKY